MSPIEDVIVHKGRIYHPVISKTLKIKRAGLRVRTAGKGRLLFDLPGLLCLSPCNYRKTQTIRPDNKQKSGGIQK